MLIGFPLNVDVDMLTLSSLNVGTYVDMLCDHNGIESRQKSPSGAPQRPKFSPARSAHTWKRRLCCPIRCSHQVHLKFIIEYQVDTPWPVVESILALEAKPYQTLCWKWLVKPLKPLKQQYRRSNGRRPAEAGPLYVGTYVDVDQLSKCWKKAFNIYTDP